MRSWGMLAVAAAAITFGSTLAMPDVAVAAAEGGASCGTYAANQKITRSEILARSRTWISARVPYSQSDCFGNKYGAYRTDCSGYISMVWGLRISYTTHILEQVAHRIDWEDLKPGDALNDRLEHVALFIGWADAAKTRPIVREQAGPDGSKPVQRVWSAATARKYVPLRYNNLVEAGASTGSTTPVTDEPEVLSGPQISNIGSQSLDVYARAADGTIVTNFHKTSRWNGWQQLGQETFAGDPVALFNPETKIVEVFARGTDGKVYRRLDGQWVALGDTAVAGQPVLLWNAKNKAIEVLARGADDVLLRWTDKWAPVGDRKIAGNPVVADKKDVYARSADGRLVKFDGEKWADQGDMKIASDPSVAVNQIFVRSATGTVEQYAAGVWKTLGGKGTGAPSAVFNATTGAIDVVALGEDGYVEHTRSVESGWSAWTRLGAIKAAEEPTAMYHAQTKTLEVFARTDDGKLLRRFYKEKAGWSQWALLSDRPIS